MSSESSVRRVDEVVAVGVDIVVRRCRAKKVVRVVELIDIKCGKGNCVMASE